MPLQDRELAKIAFENFMKGVITRIPPERCPMDAFTSGENVSLNEKFLPIIALGQYKYNATTLGAYPIRGACVYKTTAGTKYYVAACAGFIWYSVAGSGTFAKYQLTLNSQTVDMTVNEDTDFEFAQYNGRLYIVNGKYPIITNDHSSDHQYTTSRMIKITTTTVVGLTVSDIPSGLKHIWVNKERLYGLNSIAQGSGLFWTNAYFDYSTNSEANWTPTSGLNYDYVGKDDGESGSGLYPFQNSMFVFKDRNIYRYSTDGDITNWGSVRIDTTRGCPFHRTIQLLDGYLYWLSYEGIVRSDGTNVDLIDDNIRDQILKLPQMSSNSRQWNIATTSDFDAGVTFPEAILKTGTATSGAATYIIDTVNLTEADDYWNGKYVQIVSGTNLGKIAQITDFDHATAKIIFGTMTTACDSTTKYRIYTTATPILGDLIDTSDNQLQQKSQKSYFAEGSFGAKVIQGTADTTANVRLLAQSLAADWNAGTFVNTAVSGDTVILQSFTTAITNLALNKSATASRVDQGYPVSCVNDGNNDTAWFVYKNRDEDRWVYVDLGSVTGIKRSQLRITSAIDGPGHNSNTYAPVAKAFLYQGSNDASSWTTIQTFTPSGIGIQEYDLIQDLNYRYFRVYQAYDSSYYYNEFAVYEIRLFNDSPSSGSFVTQTLDFGFTPVALGLLSAIYTTNNGTSLAFSTRTSDDGNTWDAYVAVNAGGTIGSTTRRYIQAKVDFFVTNGTYSSTLQKIMISAPFISKIMDYGITPASFGNFSPSVSTPSTSTITYKTRSSADGLTWEAWATATAAAAITSTAARYFQFYALLNPSTDGTQTPQINDVFIAGQWRSAITNLGVTPASWGNFDTTYILNAQTITWWMRSATTSGGIAAATWYQQTSGAPVVTVAVNQYVQVEIRLNTTLASAIPIMQSFKVTWYTGANLLKPCSYIYNKEYCLNVADVGQSVNNIVWRYSTYQRAESIENIFGYFVKRTNRGNNVYFIDEGILLSGTSASDGFIRKNEIGSTDDGTAIDAWFITKNVNQNGRKNIFKSYKLIYKSDQAWTLSYSLDNGATWTALTIPASSEARELVKTIPGLVLGRFLMLKCRQTLEDTNWAIELIEFQFNIGYESSDD